MDSCAIPAALVAAPVHRTVCRTSDTQKSANCDAPVQMPEITYTCERGYLWTETIFTDNMGSKLKQALSNKEAARASAIVYFEKLSSETSNDSLEETNQANVVGFFNNPSKKVTRVP